MRLNIGKKLKTASLNSRCTDSKKEVCFDLITLKNLKPLDLKLPLTYEFTHQQPQGRFTSFKKLEYGKSCSYFTLIQKYK